ncbi:ArgP/LysG family DNA-binding transcriptional regulator [Cognatishimia sp. D5M38]|uniref:ArgP/LysG family DNA-binding transcriptional regulator n=1 Tax=Cognatishimia coralii TaxID=3083254 RepID=A0ABU8QBB6_9RHOB
MKLDPERLRTLSTVLRTGSFETAASEMRITQSAVSQRIKLLEENVGARLVKREIPCVGTEAGLKLSAHADQVEALEKILARNLGHEVGDEPVPVNISVNVDSMCSWFGDCFGEHHDLLFNFQLNHPAYTDSLLESGQVVGAVTIQKKPVPGCDVFPLGDMVYLPVASPKFVKKHFPEGVSPSALATAPVVRFNSKDHNWSDWIRQEFGSTVTPPYHSIASKPALNKALVAGLGWGMEYIALARDDLKKGNLVLLRQDSDFRMPIYWQTSRIWRETLADFTRHICQTARKNLPQS